jgi:hypothetical protein
LWGVALGQHENYGSLDGLDSALSTAILLMAIWNRLLVHYLPFNEKLAELSTQIFSSTVSPFFQSFRTFLPVMASLDVM